MRNPSPKGIRKLAFVISGLLMLVGFSSCYSLTEQQVSDLDTKVNPYLKKIDTDEALNKIIEDVKKQYIANLAESGEATEQNISMFSKFGLFKLLIMDLQGFAAVDDPDAFDSTVRIITGSGDFNGVVGNGKNKRAPQEALRKALYQYFWDSRSIWSFLFKKDETTATSLSSQDSTSSVDTRDFTLPSPPPRQENYVPPV